MTEGAENAQRLTERSFLTKRFVAFAHDFEIETVDAALCRFLDDVLKPFAQHGRAQHRYNYVDRGPDVDPRYELHFDGVSLLSSSGGGSPLSYLFGDINSQLVQKSNDYLLLHAAGAELGGRAIVIPGSSGSGKSTLVTELLRDGFRYITDEAVAVDQATGEIKPFPKPISLKSGSWHLFPELEPVWSPELKRYATTDWLVDPCSVRTDALARPSRPALIVSPAYTADGETRLFPLRPVETLKLLVDSSFNFANHGQRGLDHLASIVRQAPAYRLQLSDLGQARHLVKELFLGQKIRPHPPQLP